MTSESSKVSGVTSIQSSGVDEIYRAMPYITGTRTRKHLGWFDTKKEAEDAVKTFRKNSKKDTTLEFYNQLSKNPSEWNKEAMKRLSEITAKYEASK